MKIQIVGGIYLSTESWNAGDISFFKGTPKSFGEYVLLAPHTIETEIGDVDTNQLQIDALKKKIEEVKIEAEMKVNAINMQISTLLCIENKPTGE